MQIDKDIPIPETRGRGGAKNPNSIRATLQTMELYDSFLYPKSRSTILTFIHKYKGDRAFSTRIVEGGVRVWRTK